MLCSTAARSKPAAGVGVQGHFGQFLAILAQSHVKPDYPMMVDGKQFTLADLIEQEKATCVAGEELTFKLIALIALSRFRRHLEHAATGRTGRSSG